MEKSNKRLIIDRDGNWVGYEGVKDLTVEDIAKYALQHEGSQISDFVLNIFGPLTTYPTKVGTSALEKYYRTEENGEPVDFTEHYPSKGCHYLYDVLKAEPIKIICENMAKIGINPWLSFRMNDSHCVQQEVKSGLPDLFYEHRETLRSTYHHDRSTSYYYSEHWDKLFDYGHEIVREYFKNIIDEALDLYDAYGIELDFQRDIYCFSIGGEWDGLEIMNQFVRDVKAITNKYAEKYGHPIKIAVRVASTIEINYDWGFDVLTWAREGLVDMICPTPRWASSDNDIPVRLWKIALAPFGDIELVPYIEQLHRPYPGQSAPINPDIELFAGHCANYYYQGADKIGFYNHFLNLNSILPVPHEVSIDPDFPNGYWSTIALLGDEEFVSNKMNRRHVVTFNDIPPVGKPINSMLPRDIKVHETFKMCIGHVPEGAELTFKFTSVDDKALENIPVVFINGHRCEYIGTEQPTQRIAQSGIWAGKTTLPHKSLCYRIPVEAHTHYLRPDIIAQGTEFTVDYMEVYVKVV